MPTRPTLPTAPPSQPIKPAANNNITIKRLDPAPHLKPPVIPKTHISPHTVIPSFFPYSPLRRSPSQSSPHFNLFFRSSQSLSKPSQTMSDPHDLNLFMSSPSSTTRLPNPHLQTLILLSFEPKKKALTRTFFPSPHTCLQILSSSSTAPCPGVVRFRYRIVRRMIIQSYIHTLQSQLQDEEEEERRRYAPTAY